MSLLCGRWQVANRRCVNSVCTLSCDMGVVAFDTSEKEEKGLRTMPQHIIKIETCPPTYNYHDGHRVCEQGYMSVSLEVRVRIRCTSVLYNNKSGSVCSSTRRKGEGCRVAKGYPMCQVQMFYPPGGRPGLFHMVNSPRLNNPIKLTYMWYTHTYTHKYMR